MPVRRRPGKSTSCRRGNSLFSPLPASAGRGSALPPRRTTADLRLGGFFVELPGHQLADSQDGGFGLRPDRGARDGRSRSRRQHHQSHDRGAADRLIAAGDPDFGIEALDHLDEFCRRTRVQAALVDDQHFTGDRTWRHSRSSVFGRRIVFAHLPARTRLAMVTYLRPASCAIEIASGSERSSRTLASFTSIGRLMPASTSTFGRLMQEIARLDGVPPNMSVRTPTPSPLSTRLAASIMSLRHKSESSSAPIVTASICFCGPMTCSSAALNSSARRPWVTSTRPIIGNSSWVLFGAPHERATLTIQSPRARGDLCVSPGNWPCKGRLRRSLGRDTGPHMVTNSLHAISRKWGGSCTCGCCQCRRNQGQRSKPRPDGYSRYLDTLNAG